MLELKKTMCENQFFRIKSTHIYYYMYYTYTYIFVESIAATTKALKAQTTNKQMKNFEKIAKK